MSECKIIICRILKDLILFTIAGSPLIFNLITHDHKAGFFCDDHSLMYPFKESTVSSEVVAVLSVAVPTIVFGCVEYIKKKGIRMEFKLWFKITYNTFFIYYFGILATCSVMWLPKFFDGGLRPHFIDTCKPIMNDGSTCKDEKNLHRFVEDYKCSEPNVPHNVYRTFPSGHATISSYTMVYVTVYLQCKLKNKGYRIVRTCIQWVFLSTAIYISLSRVYDHHHHVIDVVFGVFLGTTSALLFAKYMSELMDKKIESDKCSFSKVEHEMQLRRTVQNSDDGIA